jgi:hypothetical protein
MTEPTFRNDGIIIAGHADVRDSALAAGPHAQATASPAAGPWNAVLHQLEELRLLIEEHADEIPEFESALRDVTDVHNEVARMRDGRTTDRGRIRHALERLAERAPTIGAVATAVDKLKDLILGHLH